MINSKRGLSKIVTTLIIMLLTFIAIGVVWIVIQDVLTKGVEEIDVSFFTLDFEILKVFFDPVDNNLTVVVKRNPGIGDFQAIRFAIFDGTITHIYDLPISNFLELETKSFKFPDYIYDVKSLKIAPIFISGTGAETIKGIGSIVKFEENEIIFIVPEVEENETTHEFCEPTVVIGEDYSFPYEVQANNFSGLIASTNDLGNTYNQRIAWLKWKDLEPERGVYDWDVLETTLRNAENSNQSIQFWMISITCGSNNNPNGITIPCAVPDWVFTRYNLDSENLPSLGGQFDIRIIPGWQFEIRNDFNSMIRALGEVYGDDPRIASVYVQAISDSRGEEFFLGSAQIDNLEQNWNFSPLILEEWLKSRMDAFSDAFSGRENICAWVGKTENWNYVNPEEYVVVGEELLNYAWSKGMGNRGGIVEKYYTGMKTTEKSYGLIFDNEGYIMVNQSHPPIANNLYFGDENEEYNNENEFWVNRYCGGNAQECLRIDPYRYRMSMMRTIMNQLNHIWLYSSDYLHNLNPGLREYTRLSLGKNINDSPDAWSFLFEHPTGGFMTPTNKFKNFEHWLYQRDFPGGITVPDEPFILPFDAGGNHNNPERWLDYTVRRTDFASGNNSIYFYLDHNFIVDGDVQMKVEILDNSLTSWHIEYVNKEGAISSTPIINTLNDGLVKTYTFEFSDDISFPKSLDNNMDFRIVNSGSADISVKWVRLIRDVSFTGC